MHDKNPLHTRRGTVYNVLNPSAIAITIKMLQLGLWNTRKHNRESFYRRGVIGICRLIIIAHIALTLLASGKILERRRPKARAKILDKR
jgi:hypothetical protein